MSDWRATYAERFNARAIERPERPPVPIPYVRPTDEEIAALPEDIRPTVQRTRDLWDAWSPVRAVVEAFSEACRQMVERQTTQRDVAPMEGP